METSLYILIGVGIIIIYMLRSILNILPRPNYTVMNHIQKQILEDIGKTIEQNNQLLDVIKSIRAGQLFDLSDRYTNYDDEYYDNPNSRLFNKGIKYDALSSILEYSSKGSLSYNNLSRIEEEFRENFDIIHKGVNQRAKGAGDIINQQFALLDKKLKGKKAKN